MKNFFVIMLLLFPEISFSQVGIKFSHGYGFHLGSPYDGALLSGDISLFIKNRWILKFKIDNFKSSTGKYYQATSYGPSIVESTLSSPVPIFLTHDETSLFTEGLKTIPSKLRKMNYTAYNLMLGYSFCKKGRTVISTNFGGSMAKFDHVFTPTIIDAHIDLGPFGEWDTAIYSTAYVTYWDLGIYFSLEYKRYIYKTLSFGAELGITRYMWSDDGYYYGAFNIGIDINKV